ncbi:Uncharacterized protein FKW44_020758 [Caligus rogercresseyi]|uniref:Uncharacterized protein n=1 Tax=Caligus rogercresseyi TaxID=217165 RepID=A0A7T8GQH4_CALRO|nr:Uncharacterized protein FKW44_020758 [Caligus rogercresseyi]
MSRGPQTHTWYLTGTNVIFALWSRLVDDDTKKEIAEKLLLPENEECEIPLGKPDLPEVEEEDTLSSFVTPESWLLFQVNEN